MSDGVIAQLKAPSASLPSSVAVAAFAVSTGGLNVE